MPYIHSYTCISSELSGPHTLPRTRNDGSVGAQTKYMFTTSCYLMTVWICPQLVEYVWYCRRHISSDTSLHAPVLCPCLVVSCWVAPCHGTHLHTAVHSVLDDPALQIKTLIKSVNPATQCSWDYLKLFNFRFEALLSLHHWSHAGLNAPLQHLLWTVPVLTTLGATQKRLPLETWRLEVTREKE